MRLLAGALVLLAFLAPFLLFGGRVWSSLVLLSAALCAAAAGVAALGEGARFHRGVLGLLAIPFAIGLFQLLPLPHGLIESLSPVRAGLQAAVPVEDLDGWADTVERTMSLSELLGDGGGEGEAVEREVGSYSLSFDPAGTRLALMALLAGALLLSSLAGQRDETLGLRSLALVLACVAAGAVFGLWRSRTGATGPLYGIFEPPAFDHHRPYGTFWNLNHFAGLCALSCPVLLAALLDGGRRMPVRLAAGVALVPCALAVLDAGSRGGLLAGGAGALLLGLLLVRVPERRLVGLALCSLSAVALVLAFTLFSERLIDESFEETTALGHESNRQRVELYQRQLRMVASAPLVGNGLGAFHDAHGPYKETAISVVPHHGESDWIETAVETGVLGWLAWVALVGLLWWPPAKAAWSGRAPPLLCGLLAGSAATVAHAAVDFQHREPAVAVVSVLLAATACCWARRLQAEDGEAEPPESPRWQRWVAIACLVLGVLIMSRVQGALAFDLGRDGALRAFQANDWLLGLDSATQAREARPGDGQGWALEAAAHENLAKRTRGEGRREHRKLALEASAEAIRRSPATLGAARRAGTLLLAVGATSEARRAAELAVAAAPGHSPSRQLLGEVLLAEDEGSKALEQLAFAYEGVPVFALSTHAVQFSRLLHEAAGGDARALLGAVTEPHHRVWYLSTLGREGRQDELPAYFALLAEEPPPEDARSLVGVLLAAPGPEAAALAATLEPAVEDPHARELIGRMLVDGGRVDQGAAVLEELITRADAPPAAWITLSRARSLQAREDLRLQVLREGLERHPGHEQLARHLNHAESD